MRVIPLNCPGKQVNQWMSALASVSREMTPVCSVASASNSQLKKVLAPAVHFVAWNNLPMNFWNFLIGIEPVDKSLRQKSRASSTLAGSMAMVRRMVSKTTPIQVMIVVGPSHLSGAASKLSWAIRSRRWW